MYVVYEEVNGVKWPIKRVETAAGAKRSVTCLLRKQADQLEKGIRGTETKTYGWMSSEDWAARTVPMKRVRNLISGEEMEIPADTPASCDPSRETYWST